MEPIFGILQTFILVKSFNLGSVDSALSDFLLEPFGLGKSFIDFRDVLAIHFLSTSWAVQITEAYADTIPFIIYKFEKAVCMEYMFASKIDRRSLAQSFSVANHTV